MLKSEKPFHKGDLNFDYLALLLQRLLLKSNEHMKVNKGLLSLAFLYEKEYANALFFDFIDCYHCHNTLDYKLRTTFKAVTEGMELVAENRNFRY